jgi:hypothetical protein
MPGIDGGQLNAGAGNNQPLRLTLQAIVAKLTQHDAVLGTGPLQKVDAATPKTAAPPAQSTLSVVGANGVFTISFTLPQQATGAPQNSSKSTIYQEVSWCASANFTSGSVTTNPLVVAGFTVPGPGQTLWFRLRSTTDQVTYNSYQTVGPISAGLQTSAASQPNLSLNQTNYATVDSIAAGATATVRVYGSSGGVGTSWSSILGNSSKVIPSGTIMNVAYAATGFVVWDGAKYQLKPQLAQVFTDTWIPVGKVSVIANGEGLVLPTIKAIVTSGAIVAYQILTAGNGMTSPPILTITDSTGSGATATAVISAGALTQVNPGSAGSLYSGTPTVTPSGGISGGVGGGGGPTGQNTGRFYGGTT